MICRPTDKTADEYCPITSFAFDLDAVEQTERNKYSEVQLLRGGVAVQNRSIWYSKEVLQHAIDVIRVHSAIPCEDEHDIGAHIKQSFHYSEMARSVRGCRKENRNF